MWRLSLKLPDGRLVQLAAEATSRGVTKSQVVRESLEKALYAVGLHDAPSCYDLAHDLAGRVRGLPEDLATNPRHMDDFGKR
jgi:hypothetical protein